MAGERVLAIQECPDEVAQIVGITVNDRAAITTSGDMHLFTPERDTIIDTAFVWWRLLDDDGTLALQVDGVTISNVMSTNQAADTVYEFVLDRDKNLIPAGSSLYILTTSSTTLDYTTVQLRLRSRIR